MNYDLPHLEDLDRYLNGNMPAPELAAFRLRLATDKALMSEMELYQTLRTGIKSFHRKRLQQQMFRFEAEFQKNAIPFYQKSIFRKLSIAASVAAAIGVGIFVWNQQTRQQPDWQAAYIDDPGLPVLMGSEKASYNQAMNFYRQGNFKQALQSLPANTSDTASFYRGIFWLKLQNPDSAYQYLNPLRKQDASVFSARADYYTAMALWQAGKNQEAKQAFEKIAADQNHPFQDISVKILGSF